MFDLSPRSLWTLLLQVVDVMVVFIPCLGLVRSYGVWVGDGIGDTGVLMWYKVSSSSLRRILLRMPWGAAAYSLGGSGVYW